MVDNKFKKGLLIASLSLNVLFILFFIGKRFYYSHWSLFHHVKLDRWSEYLKSKPDTGEIIFLGTSITEGFPVKKEFNNPKVKNMGFAGSISENGIQVIKRLIYRRPQKVFLEFGVNDFKYHISADTVKSNLITMIDIIKAKSPNTKIYVQSVFPTNIDSLNNKIVNYNKEAESICLTKEATFINLYPDFLKGNKIDSDLTIDGTHLSTTGYFNWRRLIDKYVN
ncbi:GDSL-type esterase/lipase family protein [Mucilaginibacter sp. Mucisp86]|uniref:GDSL-type esterase/lipase family protein n=1 Tax=Mucilaginibacter sp. Mucisp86 TaxID=3243060 RepID=UPI0039B42F6F